MRVMGVAGGGRKRRRSVFWGRTATQIGIEGKKVSQVSRFLQTCDILLSHLRRRAPSPATACAVTCDTLLSHLRRTTFPKGAHAATTTATPAATASAEAKAKATAAASPPAYNFSATLASQGAPNCFTAPSHQRVGRMLCQNTMAVAPVATR